MIKMIVFDFDGTIADTLPAALKIANGYLKKLGYKSISRKELTDLRNMSPFQILKTFKFPIWKLPGLVKKIQGDLYKEIDSITLFPGMEKTLLDLSLAQYRLGIITSNRQETVDAFLRKNRLTYFEMIMCEPSLLEKPRYIHKFLKEQNLKPEEILYIGDEIRDIEASRENGVKIISVTWGFNEEASLKKNNPDYLVRTPEELFTLLEKLVGTIS